MYIKSLVIMALLAINTQINGLDYVNLQNIKQKLDNIKSEKRLKILEQNAENAPNDKTAIVNLASFYLQQNQNSKAIKTYQQAILLDSLDAKLFTAISIAYLHNKHYKMAKAMVEQALNLDPNLKQAEKLFIYIDKKQAKLAELQKSAM